MGFARLVEDAVLGHGEKTRCASFGLASLETALGIAVRLSLRGSVLVVLMCSLRRSLAEAEYVSVLVTDAADLSPDCPATLQSFAERQMLSGCWCSGRTAFIEPDIRSNIFHHQRLDNFSSEPHDCRTALRKKHVIRGHNPQQGLPHSGGEAGTPGRQGGPRLRKPKPLTSSLAQNPPDHDDHPPIIDWPQKTSR